MAITLRKPRRKHRLTTERNAKVNGGGGKWSCSWKLAQGEATLRTMFRPTLRRPAAVLGLLTLGLFVAEPLIADACDRDGRGVVWSLDTSTSTPSLDGPAPPSPSPMPKSPPDHAVHVCHCVHGHFGGLPKAQALHLVPVVVKAPIAPLEQGRVSGKVQPPLRPPIA